MPIFEPADEADVTRTIAERWTRQLLSYIDSDAVIVGAGPAGMACARDLGRAGRKVLVVENNNYLGGGFWIGGYGMNYATVRKPAHLILDEIGCRYEDLGPQVAVFAPEANSKLIADACDAGAFVLNLTRVEDVVLRGGDGERRVGGVVINWSMVQALPRQITCVDPVALHSKVVIDCSGHDAYVAHALAKRGLLQPKGLGAMNVEESEDAVVEHTGEVFPGLILAGMSVAEFHGLPRMGPTFGAMLLSGRKAAQEALRAIERQEQPLAMPRLEPAPVR